MSTAAQTSASPAFGPRLRTKIAAIVVLIALGCVAYYAVFSGPTTVAVPGPTISAPAQTAPPAGEPGEEGGERGD